MLHVSASPHIRQPKTTRQVMLDVIIGLMPALIAALFIFGYRSFLLVVVSVVSAVLSEAVSNKLMKRKQSIGDLSAVVTGIILAFCVPATLPLWMVAIGAIVAIVGAKMIFGGLGDNFANPAVTGRLFIGASFGAYMSNFAVLGKWTAETGAVDLVSQATPLAISRGMAVAELPDKLTLFLGTYAGTIGEVSSLAILIGAAWLLVRRIIDFYIAGPMIITTVLLSWLAGGDPLVHLLSGGLLFGAFFMATDYVTSPITTKGKLIFGFSCGLLTFVFRMYSAMPEGVSYSILLMNIMTPQINKWTKPMTVGGAKNGKK